MFKPVDDDHDVEGFSYTEENGQTATVTLADTDGVVTITADSSVAHVFASDIPKLIKALQAAYDHKG